MRDQTETQLLQIESDLLNSFIGSDGNYFETIFDYPDADIGTKCIFLEKAITEDCDTFLRSVDKLYSPKGDCKEEAAQMEFITSLKFVNDISFNNLVKYGDFGIRRAINHYFSLGSVLHVSSPVIFKETVKKIILKRIQELKSLFSDEELERQKITWGLHETDEFFSIEWRSKMDLPLSQSEYIAINRKLELLGLINNACKQENVTKSDLKKYGIEGVPTLKALYFLIVYFSMSLKEALAEVCHLNPIEADVLRYGFRYGLRKKDVMAVTDDLPAYKIALKLVLQKSISEDVALKEIKEVNEPKAFALCELAAFGLRSYHLKMFGDEFSNTHANALIFFIKYEGLSVEYVISNLFLLNKNNILSLEKEYKKLLPENKLILHHFIEQQYSLYHSIQNAKSTGDLERFAIESTHYPKKVVFQKPEMVDVNPKKAITDIIVGYIKSRTKEVIKNDFTMDFDHRLFKGFYRNKDKTYKKLVNASVLLREISNCTTMDDIKKLIRKSIDDNRLFEKDSWHSLTKSHYACDLEKCNKIIDHTKIQVASFYAH